MEDKLITEDAMTSAFRAFMPAYGIDLSNILNKPGVMKCCYYATLA